MTVLPDANSGGMPPEVSFIMPCYNEESIIPYTVPRLVNAFQRAGYRLELIAVDNGSWDQTGEIIKELGTQYPTVLYHRVEKNEGYGHGVLCGLQRCRAPWVGVIPADGQVDAEDVVRLYEAVVTTDGRTLGKVRRRFRMDGLRRKAVSIAYNLFARVLWPSLDSLDFNGSPKLLRREVLMAMDLKSRGWLLDPEIMIKAHYMGIRVLEFNVFARMRGSGVSHVRIATCWEFLQYLLLFRFSSAWRRDFQGVRLASQTLHLPAAVAPAPNANMSNAGTPR